jgi:asparaginyl-tRNA synthetase
MSVYVRISEITGGGHTGKEVAIRGWIHRKRESGKLVFLQVRDSSGVLQALVEKAALPPDQFDAAKKALIESSLIITGTVAEDKRAPGGYELKATKVEIIGYAGIFPIGKDQSEELLLDNRHLWIRSREQNAIMKVKASMLRAAREWFDTNDFFEVTPSVITTNACEGGSTLFPFKYFEKQAYLSQSAQMYLEACIFNLEKVYALTPSFRAEKSRTIRHLAEYSHLEAEEAWVGNDGNMKIQEELVSAMCQAVAKTRGAELELLGRNPQELKLIEPPFARHTYDDAIKKLQKKELLVEWGMDLGINEERALTEDEEKPIFIVNYPKQIKAFYMKENPADPRTYLCADLLAPGGFGEIIGGSERETDAGKLVERLKAENAVIANYEWYLDLRRYGSVSHSGFGMGIERMLMWICKLPHIRDATPFPRVMNRAYP